MEPASQLPLTKLHYRLFLRYLIIAGFVAGSLDGLTAIFILSHGNASGIFKFISSGIYGKEAFAGGNGMVLLGIALHYFFAFCFATFYFIIFKYVTILHKNIWLSAVLYGLFVYIFMNIIVMSLSNAHISSRTPFSMIKNVVILIICIALPIVYFRRAYDLKR
jgi:hypothetical protein